MPGIGRVKTKSDLVVCRAEDKFLRFFALRMTTEPKISGAFIPRRVFTQPGSERESTPFGLMSASTNSGLMQCSTEPIAQSTLLLRPVLRQNRISAAVSDRTGRATNLLAVRSESAAHSLATCEWVPADHQRFSFAERSKPRSKIHFAFLRAMIRCRNYLLADPMPHHSSRPWILWWSRSR
jgi:hypothetical protein